MTVSELSDETLTSISSGVGESIRRIRKNQGMSQAELARRVGMRQPAITRLERGHHVPTLRTLSRIADALDSTVRVDIVSAATIA